MLWMLPAQQCLDADHAVVAVVYLGLVDQVQLVLRQSIAQILFQLTAAAHLAVDAGDVELVAIARTTLGQGHGLFGFLQQLFGTVTIFREQGDADGGAQAHFVLIEQERQLQVVEYALRQFGGFVGLFDVGLNQGELVTTQTGQCAQAAAMAAQAVGQCEQQLVAALVAELFVDALEVIQADAEHGDAALQAAGVFENLVELLLQLLAVGQAGEEVVLSHAQQAVLGLPAQVGVALDGGQQLVGGVDPQTQLVLLVALEHGQLVFAGAIRVDVGEVLDDLRQRFGQQPVIDQIEHQAHGHGAQHAGDEDDHRVGDEALAIRGRVEGDVEVAVVFAVGASADQFDRELLLLAKNRVGQPACRHLCQVAGFFRQHGLVRVADGGVTHRFVLEQPLDHLHAHLAVQAVYRLGRRVAEHAEDAMGIVDHRLTCLVGVEDNLRTTQYHSYYEC